MTRPPDEKAIAVEFARRKFTQQEDYRWQWPEEILRYAERCGECLALKFAATLYKELSVEMGRAYWLDYLRELEIRVEMKNGCDTDELDIWARAIWDDGRDHTFAKRGIARLAWALAYRCRGELSEYERQLRSSLKLFTTFDDDRDELDRDRFERAILAFQTEFS
jgi:hypothetical protein